MVASRRRPLLGFAVLVLVGTAIAVALIGGESAFRYDDPFDPFPRADTSGTGGTVGGAPDPQAELAQFVSFVAGDVQGFWERTFRRSGRHYEPARVVLFRGSVLSGCGPASAAVGPFYCPLDGGAYLELGFFRALAVHFRAPGDFAQAYVVAHELAHHLQTITGVTAQVERAAAEGLAAPNDLSVRLELQADCLAGVWGHSTYERGLLERGDLDEGLTAAAAVGDDRIQARATGRIDPETWTHGSSEQRRSWFLAGFTSGDPDACDTFSA